MGSDQKRAWWGFKRAGWDFRATGCCAPPLRSCWSTGRCYASGCLCNILINLHYLIFFIQYDRDVEDFLRRTTGHAPRAREHERERSRDREHRHRDRDREERERQRERHRERRWCCCRFSGDLDHVFSDCFQFCNVLGLNFMFYTVYNILYCLFSFFVFQKKFIFQKCFALSYVMYSCIKAAPFCLCLHL